MKTTPVEDLVEGILSGKAYQAPSGSEGGRALKRLVAHRPGSDAWFASLVAADERSIIAAIGGIEGVTGSAEAYRDAARAMVEQKLAERTIREMRRLELVGIVLAVVGLLVAIPSAILAGVQLWPTLVGS